MSTNGTRDAQREQILNTVKAKFGFVPNLIRELAENPLVANTYVTAGGILADGDLSAREQQAVQLAVATHNQCHYCTAAHGTIGLGAGLSHDDISAIFAGERLQDDRLATVVDATRLVLDRRGWLEPTDLQDLEGRGLTRAELYEIIAFIGVKTISNYINHIAQTAIDPQFNRVTELPAYQELIVQKA
jgi:AhpD family alkylhydroperoxidase